MAQPILKRRLNPLLLISTVAALSLLAAVAVLAQDQVDDKKDRIYQLNQSNIELNNTVRRLEAKLYNRSSEIDDLEVQISNLKNKKNSLNDTIQQKNQEISNLESQLEEARLEVQNSNNVDEINKSLSTVCFLGETWQARDIAVEKCEEWGHQIGSGDEG